MREYDGYQVIYEVIGMPKGKWGILIEIMHRESGRVIVARHNPFPAQAFDTKLEALEHVNLHIDDLIAERGAQRSA